MPRRASLFLHVALLALAKPLAAQDLAVVDATVYTSPHAVARTHTTILIQAGKITALGQRVRLPPNVPVLACAHCVVFAGFWNTHVHFTGPQWTDAVHAEPARLIHELQAMLTHSGFTSVVDTASDPENTVALRRRIDAGELLGPRIYTAGAGLYPPHGIPFYLADLPEAVRAQLPQPSTPAAAVQHNQAEGTDLVKLFVGSYLTPDHIVHMPLAVALAAVTEGHKHGQLVFAHPSDLEGIRIAMNSGVDVLAHAPDTVDGIDDALISQLVQDHIAMTPTLKLFSGSMHIAEIRNIVAKFHKEGGILLFGTDTGFLPDADVSEEYRQLSLAGLTFPDVLTMLTSAPASAFKTAAHAGTIQVGNNGDLAILSSDPATGPLEGFAHVLYTVRAGRIVFDAAHPQ